MPSSTKQNIPSVANKERPVSHRKLEGTDANPVAGYVIQAYLEHPAGDLGEGVVTLARQPSPLNRQNNTAAIFQRTEMDLQDGVPRYSGEPYPIDKAQASQALFAAGVTELLYTLVRSSESVPA